MTPGSTHISLLYQDDDLLVVNKPSGLLSIQDGYDVSLPHLRSVLEPVHGELWVVHRLDKETSGVILLARNPEAHRMMNESFRNRQVEKRYHGLVTPVPTWKELDIQFPLRVDADRKHRTRVDIASGKIARSICQVLKYFDLGALIKTQLLTGITHQIRAHLRADDLALFGDLLYNAGLPEQPLQSPRMMLHAHSLTFDHPITDAQMHIIAPYPDDFRDFYTQLRFTRAQDVVT